MVEYQELQVVNKGHRDLDLIYTHSTLSVKQEWVKDLLSTRVGDPTCVLYWECE